MARPGYLPGSNRMVERAAHPGGSARTSFSSDQFMGHDMLAADDEQRMFQKEVRRFVEAEIAPKREELEHGDLAPYGVLRKYYETFGIGDDNLARFEATIAGEAIKERRSAAEVIIPMVEFARHCPGLVTALGATIGLTASAIKRDGNDEQRLRWLPDLLTLRKVGAWAITEPGSGSDAFGSMRATARRVGDEYILNGTKTFISNGPDADTVVFIAKLDDKTVNDARPQIMTFVLDRGMSGFEQSKPLRKMGLHSSPTGELFLHNVSAGEDRVLHGRQAKSVEGAKKTDGSRKGARAVFAAERASVAAIALGIVERCLELSVDYAKNRVQFGKRIGDYQLIQHKLAHMEVARLNIENLVRNYIAMVDAGQPPSLAEASAMKLYSAQAATAVALEAVQVWGGNGYMSENHVEQLARDAKVLQIYAGTDEIQVTHIARDLLV
jgi:acyl-CoA dehydrogenase